MENDKIKLLQADYAATSEALRLTNATQAALQQRKLELEAQINGKPRA